MGKLAYVRAHETAMMFAPDYVALKDRAQFVENLGDLLSQTREGIIRCELDPETDIVTVYRGGDKVFVNVRMDSYMAIVRDVTKALR